MIQKCGLLAPPRNEASDMYKISPKFPCKTPNFRRNKAKQSAEFTRLPFLHKFFDSSSINVEGKLKIYHFQFIHRSIRINFSALQLQIIIKSKLKVQINDLEMWDINMLTRSMYQISLKSPSKTKNFRRNLFIAFMTTLDCGLPNFKYNPVQLELTILKFADN